MSSIPRRVVAPLIPKRSCAPSRSEEHTSELQAQSNLVCRLLLATKKSELAQSSTSLIAPPPCSLSNVPFCAPLVLSRRSCHLRTRRTPTSAVGPASQTSFASPHY